MTNTKYWSDYYKNKSLDEIPWNHAGDKIINFVFKKYNLPKTGDVLDVGTGTGKKADKLQKMGFEVYAFDVTEKAFLDTKKENLNINFFVTVATELYKADTIKGIKFDIVFDLLVTQFLDKKEKQKYLSQLNSYLKNNTYYILQTFFKGKGNEDSELNWVNNAAQSREEIDEIYGNYFKILDLTTIKGKKGTNALVVMKNK